MYSATGRFAPEKKMLSLAEVEAALIATSVSGRTSGGGQFQGYDPQVAMAARQQQEMMDAMAVELERRRREKMRKLAEIVSFIAKEYEDLGL